MGERREECRWMRGGYASRKVTVPETTLCVFQRALVLRKNQPRLSWDQYVDDFVPFSVGVPSMRSIGNARN